MSSAEIWCILQMSGGRTLAVTRSLRAAGFDVWAPTGMMRRARPRSRKYRDEPVALVSGVAFARLGDAPRLAAIVQAPVQEHPPFSLLMQRGTYGKVTDASLDPLRQYEMDKAAEWVDFVAAEEQARLEKLRKKKGRKRVKGRLNAARSYILGQTVRVEGPAFQGLTAKVLESKKKGTLVIDLGGMLGQLTVETCDVCPVHVDDAQPEKAPVT
ncbi:hypothetical protein HNO88_001594 [Novosphingobium chloroacetimidivorans]|uniref:Uncharacterized protein n=1 Tax=Novosphingobium chloroacetimidivorans TaxID=1428314 RepID=A0A7W7NWL2_9SPHN|nr:hypothetical protein [Novosphingobium chloroacetimidivorans]MBB4858275.1 hypothetical protein [Novosphingobium chloroacetimidivorans]